MATMAIIADDAEFYRPREIAKLLKISRKKVYDLMAEGLLEYIQVDHQKRIPRAEMLRLTRIQRTTRK